jgi:hypothetical protein
MAPFNLFSSTCQIQSKSQTFANFLFCSKSPKSQPHSIILIFQKPHLYCFLYDFQRRGHELATLNIATQTRIQCYPTCRCWFAFTSSETVTIWSVRHLEIRLAHHDVEAGLTSDKSRVRGRTATIETHDRSHGSASLPRDFVSLSSATLHWFFGVLSFAN